MSKRQRTCDQAARAVESALRSPKESLAETLTPIFTLTPRAISEGVTIPIPSSGAVVVPVVPAYQALELEINLSLADKLALGKSLILQINLALINSNSGGTPLYGITWSSYGPDGFHVVLRDGTHIDNPDPSVTVPLGQFAGHFVYITYITQGITNAGATINGFSAT